MPLPIFTIQTFNQNTLQPAGAVFAQRVEAVSIARNFLAGITGSEGGRNTAMEKKMNELTRSLMEELQLQTRTAYPNALALVDVKMHFSDIGKDDSNVFLAGQASATALIKRNKVATPMAPATPMASPATVPMAMASPVPMASPVHMASPVPMASPATVPLKNNSRNSKIPNNPMNSMNSGNPTKVGGRKSFISKSRKNRI